MFVKAFGVPMARSIVVMAGGLFLAASANAALFTNFPEAGQTVSGFQDDFTGTTFDSGWKASLSGGALSDPASAGTAFSLPGDGTLHMGAAGGDPNKLLYNATYDTKTQNVLALIRVTGTPTGDGLWRGGVGTAAAPGDSFRGIDFLFKTPGSEAPAADGNHIQMLNDALAWGNYAANSWSANTWYWVRLTHDASDNAVGHIWPADNATPESSALVVNQAGFGTRSGLAGLVTNSGGNGTFDVDYVLIQSAGLPSITAVPEPGLFAAISVTVMGLSVLSRRRRR